LESHRAFERFGPEGGKHPPLRGLLAVPLIARNGEALGFIQVSDRYEGDFTEHDEQLLAHFGRLAAVAVENGRLHQRVRQAEGRVHNQAELLKAVTDSTAEAILGLDDAGRISLANQVAQTLLGAPGAGLVGHCLHDIIQCEQEEADCRSGHCMVMQVLHTGRAQLARETLFTRRDGTYLPVSYSATPIERYGAISGAVISFRPLVSRGGGLGWRTAQDGPAQ
jgi:PAS domain S-box-containing protein